jgi:hypothetical protein
MKHARVPVHRFQNVLPEATHGHSEQIWSTGVTRATVVRDFEDLRLGNFWRMESATSEAKGLDDRSAQHTSQEVVWTVGRQDFEGHDAENPLLSVARDGDGGRSMRN